MAVKHAQRFFTINRFCIAFCDGCAGRFKALCDDFGRGQFGAYREKSSSTDTFGASFIITDELGLGVKKAAIQARRPPCTRARTMPWGTSGGAQDPCRYSEGTE